MSRRRVGVRGLLIRWSLAGLAMAAIFAIKPAANFRDNGSTVRAAKQLTFRVGGITTGRIKWPLRGGHTEGLGWARAPSTFRHLPAVYATEHG